MICCVMPGLLAGLLPPRGSRVMSVVMMGGGSVGLALLRLLLLVPGVTVARGEILAQVWGAEFVGT